jgi:hypothetical protein
VPFLRAHVLYSKGMWASSAQILLHDLTESNAWTVIQAESPCKPRPFREIYNFARRLDAGRDRLNVSTRQIQLDDRH